MGRGRGRGKGERGISQGHAADVGIKVLLGYISQVIAKGCEHS